METYGFATDNTGDQSMANNLLKIQVYFNTMNVETVAEDPTYEVMAVH